MVARTETKLVTLMIDGRSVTVPAGTSILQASEHAGIEVPNLCFQPLLRAWGSCRVCTVEILGARGGLIESCATPVRDGMEVSTISEPCIEARQFLLQMYLVDHALDCPTCDKSGECYLQDNTYLHNVNDNPYRRPKLARPYKHFSDTIDYKWDRCIVCARCTRVCDEMIGVTAITVAGRALEAEITPSYGVDLSETACTNCGMCIAVCPVGALTDRHFGHHPWELDTVETICGFCDVGCTLNVEHNRGLVRRVSHLWDRGVNEGYTCERGKWGHEVVQDPTRLRHASLRESGEMIEVDLEEALDAVAEQFRHYQGSSFAALVSPDLTNEEAFAAQQFTRAVMGSNSISRLLTDGQASVEASLEASFGVAASPAGVQEMRSDSSVYLLVGPSITEHAPVASYWLYWAMRYREAQGIVVTSDFQYLCERSNRWIKAAPGSEADVLLALTKIIIDEGLATDQALAASLTRQVARVDVAAVAAATGTSVELLTESARLYASGGRGKTSTIWHTVAARIGEQSDVATAANNLSVLCGHIGKPGGGVVAFRRSANTQGTFDVGATPDTLPGGLRVDDATARAAFEEAWSERWNPAAVSQNGFKQRRDLPATAGVGGAALIAAINAGTVKAVYIAAQSHKWSAPIAPELLAALAKVEYLVVEDCFDSALTELAHVVLPNAMFLEKDGSFTNVDRTVQRVRFAVAAPGEAQPTSVLLNEIADRLGYALHADHAPSMMEEISSVVPNYSGVSMPRLERAGMQWPVSAFGNATNAYLSVGHGLAPDAIRIVAD